MPKGCCHGKIIVSIKRKLWNRNIWGIGCGAYIQNLFVLPIEVKL